MCRSRTIYRLVEDKRTGQYSFHYQFIKQIRRNLEPCLLEKKKKKERIGKQILRIVDIKYTIGVNREEVS